MDGATLVKNLEAGSSYKFLGVKESTLQDEKLALAVAANVYLHRLSVIKPVRLACSNLPYVDTALGPGGVERNRQRDKETG